MAMDKGKPLSIGIISKYLTPDILEVAKQIDDFFSKGKIKVYYEKGLGRRLNSPNTFNLENPKCNFIMTIGGDGTFLKTIMALKGKEIPVVGIRRGAMGFLAEIDKDIYYYLRRIVNNDFSIDVRTKLDVRLNNKKVGEVLNDAVIITAQPGKIQKFEMEIHGDKIGEIAADGIIISTPTGSTAYALSAGGPIIDPQLDAYEIVPIAPFKLSARPMIVPSGAKTTIHIITERKGALVLDGSLSFSLTKKDMVEIAKSESKAYIVKFEKNFYARVRNKLI